MTRRQLECFLFIKDFIEKNEYSPSYEEIRMELGMKSKGGVYRIVHILVKRNKITMIPHRSRTIEVV